MHLAFASGDQLDRNSHGIFIVEIGGGGQSPLWVVESSPFAQGYHSFGSLSGGDLFGPDAPAWSLCGLGVLYWSTNSPVAAMRR
jgi:hypothetical protein